MNKHKETKIKNFKQELLHTILIPFYIEDEKGNILKKNISINNLNCDYFSENKFLDKNSQFYDYIEDLYLSHVVSEYSGTKNVIKDLEEKLFFESKNKIKDVFIQIIENSIIILGITVKFKKVCTLENIHYQKMTISNIIKQSEIKEYINSYFNISKKYQIRYFDSYDGINIKNGKKINTVRFHTFTTLIKQYSESPLSEKEKKNISNYFLDRMAVSSPVNQKKFTEESPIFGGELYISTEGMLFIYEKSKENVELSHKFIDSGFIKKCLLISYLMNLQEYFKLHYLKSKANSIFNEKNELETTNIKNRIDELDKELIFFSAKYHITKVSSFEWIRNIYNKIYNTLEIEKYISEVNKSLSLYKQHIEQKINEEKLEIERKKEERYQKIEWCIKFFACITFCNALLSILLRFVETHIENNCLLIKTLNISFYWLSIFVCVISIFILTKLLKIDKNLKKSKKVIDK